MPVTSDPQINRQIRRHDDYLALADEATRSGFYLAASHYRSKAARIESRILATMEGVAR